jgi:hypothetical protein
MVENCVLSGIAMKLSSKVFVTFFGSYALINASLYNVYSCTGLIDIFYCLINCYPYISELVFFPYAILSFLCPSVDL